MSRNNNIENIIYLIYSICKCKHFSPVVKDAFPVEIT